jgi:predicted SprT family Zn-dependent metalloprotease
MAFFLSLKETKSEITQTETTQTETNIFQCASDEKVPDTEKRVLEMPPSVKRAITQAKRLFSEMKVTYSFIQTKKSLQWTSDRQLQFNKLLVSKWLHNKACGLQFEEIEAKEASKATIRIAIEHDGDRRPWSYEGQLAKNAKLDEPTMNLPHEALDEEDDLALQGVILHQIGHAFGLSHQHRCAHTDEKLSLTFAHVDKVHKTLGPQNTWKKEHVEKHILTKRPIPTEAEGFTNYDPLSIMVVPWKTDAVIIMPKCPDYN